MGKAAVSLRIYGLVLLVFSSWAANAQPASFVYLQTENNLPYHVLWNGQEYHSTETGYLVIPQVQAGTHTMLLNFDTDHGKETSFSVVTADKPRGFSLRLSTDNKWSLFDLINFTVIAGTAITPAEKPAAYRNPLTDFPVSKEPAEGPKTKEQDKPVITKETNPYPSAKTNQPKEKLVAGFEIKKIFDKAGNTGIDQVYTISVKGKTDTIALFIPALKEQEPAPMAVAEQVTKQTINASVVIQQTDTAGNLLYADKRLSFSK
jgi:hypothetical protein